MRSILTVVFSLFCFSLFAQAPQGIKYQAVARDNAGILYKNQQIAVRLSIVDSSDTGPVIYSERQVLNTNDFGLFSASLGQGVVLQGTFSSIAWGAAPKYLMIEFDPLGGTNYFDMGTSQLLSVPYALYAQSAGSGGGGGDNQTLSISGNTLTISNGNSVTLPTGGASYTAGTGIDVTGNVITNTAPDQTVAIIGTGTTVVSGTYPSFTVNTPAQNLSLNGNVLSISDGNSVTLPSGGGGSYVAGTGINITGTTISNSAPDQVVSITGTGIATVSGTYPNFVVNASEVPQVLSLTGTTLSLSNGGGSVSLPVDIDSDPTNELQQLSLNGNQLTITNGNTISLPSGGTPDTDSDSTNELNTNAALNGNNLEITDAGGTLTVDLTSLLNDADSDPVNEIQTLSLNGSQLTISGGNTVSLPSGGTPDADSDSTNELNTNAVLNGNSLEITDAGGTLSVDLSSLQNDADSDPANELNNAFSFNTVTNELTITDAAGALIVNLSALAGGGAADNDADSTNELQDLSSTALGNTVTLNITGGTGTTFSVGGADDDPANEIQVISLSANGDTLKLSKGGGSVLLPAGGSGGTLDDAYDFGGAGAGRTITADAGAIEINVAGTNNAGLAVAQTGTGPAILATSSNAANGYSTIQAETNSTSNVVAAVVGSTTAGAYAIAGQASAASTTESAVYGSNLRTTGGSGVLGEGFNGTAGTGYGLQGFGVFGENANAASGNRTGSLLAAGVGSIGFIGVLGQTQINDGAGVLGINLGPTRNGTFDNPGVEGQGFVGVLGQTNTPGVGWGVLAGGDIGATGSLNVVGNLTAGGAKNFRIDHPSDPANKFLYHFSVESNEVLNLYRGTVQLDANGEAVIELPEYFEAVNKNFAYQLTAIGAAAPGLFVKSEIENNKFVIAGGQAGQKISWQVTGERNDAYFANHPEERQDVRVKPAHLAGKYVHPAEYGKTPAEGIISIKNKPATSLVQPEAGNKVQGTLKLQ